MIVATQRAHLQSTAGSAAGYRCSMKRHQISTMLLMLSVTGLAGCGGPNRQDPEPAGGCTGKDTSACAGQSGETDAVQQPGSLASVPPQMPEVKAESTVIVQPSVQPSVQSNSASSPSTAPSASPSNSASSAPPSSTSGSPAIKPSGVPVQ